MPKIAKDGYFYGGNSIIPSADNISYDNSTSQLGGGVQFKEL